MHYDVVIVGGGPGGLACAARLAGHNVKVLVVEKKPVIGPKACAGGVTWSGLLRQLPDTLIERAFANQHIHTSLQNICIREPNPIIATIDRKNLGRAMAEKAEQSGAELCSNTFVQHISATDVQLFHRAEKKRQTITYDYLIGADGSTSLVRRFLNLPMEYAGIAVNFQVNGQYDKMEWHLRSNYFHSGYGWIFPHGESFSVGAYIPTRTMSGSALMNRTIEWAATRGVDLRRQRCRAGYINYDYRGWRFDKTFLVGDAAGLASALTGEGIYPAIVSGEAVADTIIAPDSRSERMEKLLKKQKRFTTLVKLTAKHRTLSAVFGEAGPLALRLGLANFSMLEMS